MIDISYYVAASLDGFIAKPDGGLDWLPPIEPGGEDYGYTAFYDSVQAVILGRKTYDLALSFGSWPYEGKSVWVFTRQPLTSKNTSVRFTSRDPRQAALDLEHAGVHRAWLVGGGELAGSFRREGLISEIILTIIPVLLGEGIPLFAGPAPVESLRLESSRTWPNGLAQVRYTVTKPVPMKD